MIPDKNKYSIILLVSLVFTEDELYKIYRYAKTHYDHNVRMLTFDHNDEEDERYKVIPNGCLTQLLERFKNRQLQNTAFDFKIREINLMIKACEFNDSEFYSKLSNEFKAAMTIAEKLNAILDV